MAEGSVLVVDDDDAIRALVVLVLRRANFTVEQAENGEQALARLRERRYHAVVLDLMMPVLSGFEVVKYLSTRDDAGKPCIIVISAAGDRDLSSVQSPCVHKVIRKPFELPALVSAVQECSEHWSGEEHCPTA
jgi:two-component system response regulator ResD